jgi:hypothetical protein
MQFEYVAATIMVPQEIQIPTIGQCSGGCGAHIVTRGRWAAIKRDVRRQLRGKFKSEAARGACRGCYTRLNETGDHIDLPTRQITDEIFAEEYNTMRSSNMSDYVIRDALGMSEAAFEKALERGRQAGRVTDAEMHQENWKIPVATWKNSGGRSRPKIRTTRGIA